MSEYETEYDIFEELQQQTAFSADTAQDAKDAIILARSAMLEKFILEADTSSGDFGDDVVEYMDTITEDTYGEKKGGFANAQLSEFTAGFQVNPYWGRMRMFGKAEYLCGADDANEAKCVAAMIAQKLSKKLKPNCRVSDVIKVFQEWVNKNFEYRETGKLSDHTATGLFRNGTGVCQAVAAVATLILPQLGVPTQYVSGKSVSDDGTTVNHAWNILKTPLRWIHADFTQGKDFPITPGTGGGFADFFKKYHQWDTEVYSDMQLDLRESALDRVLHSQICITENSEELKIGNIKITTVKPVIVSDSRGCRVDMRTLMSLLGGGFMYIPGKKTMWISTYDMRWMIGKAEADIDKETGYVDISVLEEMSADIDFDGKTYKFHF